ncbi:MAG: aminopeptidase N C-terminal domain-containing protein [Planctomycetota bacterium]
MRSLIGVFNRLNRTGFHQKDGAGYRLLGDAVITLDKINPQVASRMVGAFNSYKRFDGDRRALMEEQLRRIQGVDGLSKNT